MTINHHKPAYPPLDRTAFLVERACVPRYIPPICPEAAQILAAMAEISRKEQSREDNAQFR